MDEILVLNNYESIHDALVRQGAAFAGRPPMYRTSKSDRDKHSVVWQTYTPKLQFLRREVTQSLKVRTTSTTLMMVGIDFFFVFVVVVLFFIVLPSNFFTLAFFILGPLLCYVTTARERNCFFSDSSEMTN